MEVSRGELKKEAGWEKEIRSSPYGRLPPFGFSGLRILTGG